MLKKAKQRKVDFSKIVQANKHDLFLLKNLISIACIFACIVLGYRVSTLFLLGAVLVIAVSIFFTDVENAFYWSLFLVPNIRMFDGLGISFIVNALMALPLVVYFLKGGKKSFNELIFISIVVMFAIEFLHICAYGSYSKIINLVGWILNFYLCMTISIDKDVKINSNNIFSALSTGAILSAVMYILSGFDSIAHVLGGIMEGVRFEAFADDPNAFSIYVCLAFACIINVKKHYIYRFITLIILVFLGFLTGSKMCVLLISFILVSYVFILFFDKDKANKKFALFMLISLALIGIICKDYVDLFIGNFLRRLGGANADMNTITTGRSGLFVDYINIFVDDLSCFFLGKGFQYPSHLSQAASKYSHNTYLDVFLSWGIIGGIVFITVLGFWIYLFKRNRKIKKLTFSKVLPLIVLLAGFMSLSYFSANVFPLVLAVAFLQWIGNKGKDN